MFALFWSSATQFPGLQSLEVIPPGLNPFWARNEGEKRRWWLQIFLHGGKIKTPNVVGCCRKRAHQNAVSHPLVNVMTHWLLKECKWRRGGWKRKEKTLQKVLAISSILPPTSSRPTLALLLLWTVLSAHMTGNGYVCFNTTNAIFLLTPVLRLLFAAVCIWSTLAKAIAPCWVRVVWFDLYLLRRERKLKRLSFIATKTSNKSKNGMEVPLTRIIWHTMSYKLHGPWQMVVIQFFWPCFLALGCLVRTPEESRTTEMQESRPQYQLDTSDVF